MRKIDQPQPDLRNNRAFTDLTEMKNEGKPIASLRYVKFEFTSRKLIVFKPNSRNNRTFTNYNSTQEPRQLNSKIMMASFSSCEKMNGFSAHFKTPQHQRTSLIHSSMQLTPSVLGHIFIASFRYA